MPSLTKNDAVAKLAAMVRSARPSDLTEYYFELFPAEPATASPDPHELAEYVEHRLVGEEIVDLWNVVFPHDRHVWYDDESDQLHFNEVMVDYVD
jgi:hypothetical protein